MSTLVSPACPAATASAPSDAAPSASRQGTQGVFCVWHGLNWSTWRKLRQDGLECSSKYWARSASVAALSLWNSACEFCERVVLGAAIDSVQIDQPPLFVLGHWRSGTTLLHNLLTLDPQFASPNLYQVLFPGHFLLTERVTTALTGWLVPQTRPMDNVAAGWQMTQEDELALLLRTGVSPYLMLGFQGQRERYGRFFDLTDATTAELSAWIREFQTFLRKLTWRTGKPIVLKSPSHTYRVPLLLELFPQARFVYICRDPYAVYSSTLHLRRTMFTENALKEPNYEGLEEDALLTYAECIERYETTKSLIPSGQLHELRFEDLEADPLGEMRRLYERLNLPGWETVAPRLEAQLPSHAAYRKNRFSQLDVDTMRRVYHRWRLAFDTYGYPSQLPEADERAA